MRVVVTGKRHKDGRTYKMTDEVITTAKRFVSLIVKSELGFGAKVDSVDIEKKKIVLVTYVLGDVDVTEVELPSELPEDTFSNQLLLRLFQIYNEQSSASLSLEKGMFTDKHLAISWISGINSKLVGTLVTLFHEYDIQVPDFAVKEDLVTLFEFMLSGDCIRDLREVATTIRSNPR